MSLSERFLDREEVFSGVLLQVYRDEVELPDGSASVREWVSHPGAVAVVPVFENGDTILVRTYRYASRREFLEVPAGKMDRRGEEPEQVARRELIEEVGYAAGRLTPLGEVYPCVGYSDEVNYLYLAEDLQARDAGGDPHEFLQPVRMPFEEAVTLALSGEIQDAKSVVALVRAQAVLERRSRLDHPA